MILSKWPHSGRVQWTALRKSIKTFEAKLALPQYKRYTDAVAFAHSLAKKTKTTTSIKDGLIRVEPLQPNDKFDRGGFQQHLKQMIPWRKGPFDLFGEHIDAEWRSDLKWERIRKQVGPLQGKVVLDIGCNNGYFLFQMAKQKPKYLLGIDPVIPYKCQFDFVNSFSKLPNTEFGLFGVSELAHFERVFDVVFCLGIIYHHPDPVGILKTIYNAMKPGGLLVVESQGIASDQPVFLFPENKYLGAPGHWFLPSQSALQNIVRRSGFQYVETFFSTKLDPTEQRRSVYSPHESLTDFLDPLDSDKTVEGYPAPWRHYLKARRARIRR